MTKEEIKLGMEVRCLENFPEVPKGTIGIIVEDYGTGIMVAWDLPNKPYPDKSWQEVAKMFAVNPECPLRDGFAYDELEFLEVNGMPKEERLTHKKGRKIIL